MHSHVGQAHGQSKLLLLVGFSFGRERKGLTERKNNPVSIGNRAIRGNFIPKERKLLCVCMLSVTNQQHTYYLRSFFA